MQSEDPAFFDLLLTAVKSSSLEEQVTQYRALVARAFADAGGVWGKNETGGGWYRSEGSTPERGRWEEIFQDPRTGSQ